MLGHRTGPCSSGRRVTSRRLRCQAREHVDRRQIRRAHRPGADRSRPLLQARRHALLPAPGARPDEHLDADGRERRRRRRRGVRTGRRPDRRPHRSEDMTDTYDPITFSVMLGRFDSIVNEMTLTLEHTAWTSILAICRDFSCAVYDATPRQISMYDALPIHTTSLHLVL